MRKFLMCTAALAATVVSMPALAQESSSDTRFEYRAPPPRATSFQAVSPTENGSIPVAIASRFQYTQRVGILLRQSPRLFDRAYYGAHEIVGCAIDSGGVDRYAPFFEDGLMGREISGEIYDRFRSCASRGQGQSAGLVAPVMAEKLAVYRASGLTLDNLAVTPQFASVYIGTDREDIGPIDQYSRCLVATAPVQAFAVFATEPGTREERGALTAMETATDQCRSLEPNSGMRPSLQRASLSFAALDWATLVGMPQPAS